MSKEIANLSRLSPEEVHGFDALSMRPTANATQRNWLLQMKATVDQLHNQWYGYENGKLDQGLLADTDRKIRLACDRLGIEVEQAFDEDGWDGEQYAPIVTLWDALRAIRKHFGIER